MGAASPATNRLSEHPECGFCLNPPSFGGPLSISQLSFPKKWRYIHGSGDRHRRREKVIWEMSVEAEMKRVIIAFCVVFAFGYNGGIMGTATRMAVPVCQM